MEELLTNDSLNMVTIPKMIMQTWKTSEVPDKWKKSPASIQQHMMDWSYVLMTDEDNRSFIESYFPDFLPYFDRMKYPIERADAVRYCWLYINGGAYMDLDYEILEPLDSLFYNDCGLFIASSANFPSSLTNSFMASVPGHPFWLDVIEAIKEEMNHPTWWAKGKHLEVMMTTGPGIVDRVAKRGKHIYTVIPPGLLSPENLCQSTGKVGKMRPLEGCSWGSVDTRIYNWCFCHPVLAVIIGIILLFLIIWVLSWIWSKIRGRRNRPQSSVPPVPQN